MNLRITRIFSIIILLGFVVSTQYLITHSSIVTELQEDSMFDSTKVNSNSAFDDLYNIQEKVTNNLTADGLVLDTYNISQYGNIFHGFNFYNGSLYLIADHNSTARKVLIINTENDNFTLKETFYVDVNREDIQVTENITYLANNADTSWNSIGDIIEISTASRTAIDSYYFSGINPIVFDNEFILYLDKQYYWRYRNGRWFMRGVIKNDNDIILSMELPGTELNDLEYDNYRFSVLTNTLIMFYSGIDLSFEDSIILPGLIEETYEFSGMAFDGRYYWLLAKNTQTLSFELLKVDILARMDYDKDGLSDSIEMEIGTNLRSADTDEDGMEDYFEFIYGLNNSLDDSDLDYDADGITNIDEYYLNSNPTSNDSDNDGLLDNYELEIGTDLNNKDSDGDGLSDGVDPRPLTHIRWWEELGSSWSIVILVTVIIAVAAFRNHKKNS